MTESSPRSPVAALVASFLLTDLVGYSKGTVKDQYAAKSAFSEILRSNLALLGAGDYRVKDTGDGALITFVASPEHALYMALAITRDFEKAAAARGFPSNRLRTGLNVGTVKQAIDVEAQPNFIGDGINDTKRVMDAAQPGQIVASRSFFEGVACLDAAYAALFSHLGVVRDKHDREHDLYAVEVNAAVLDNLHRDLATGDASIGPVVANAGAITASEPTRDMGANAGPRAPHARRHALAVAATVALALGVASLFWAQRTNAPSATSPASQPATTAASSAGTTAPPATTAKASPEPGTPSVGTTAPPPAAVAVQPPSAALPAPSREAATSDTSSKSVDATSRTNRAPDRPASNIADRPRVADVRPATSALDRSPVAESKVAPAPEPSPAADADKSARCSRIIEKAALGEPLSAQETRSLERTCR